MTDCPITGLPAKYQSTDGGGSFETAKAGISYALSGSAEDLLKNLLADADFKQAKNSQMRQKQRRARKLAFWVMRQNLQGVAYPNLQEESINQIANGAIPSVGLRTFNCLLWVIKQSDGDMSCKIGNSDGEDIIISSCTLNAADSAAFITGLVDEGLLAATAPQDKKSEKWNSLQITLKGLRFCEEWQARMLELQRRANENPQFASSGPSTETQ